MQDRKIKKKQRGDWGGRDPAELEWQEVLDHVEFYRSPQRKEVLVLLTQQIHNLISSPDNPVKHNSQLLTRNSGPTKNTSSGVQ